MLARTRYRWLTGRGRTTRAEKLAFAALRKKRGPDRPRLGGEGGGIEAVGLQAPGLGRERLAALAAMASGCGLAPVHEVAEMVGAHLWGILDVVVLRATNGPAESINSRVQMVKAAAEASATTTASSPPSSSTSAASTSRPAPPAGDPLTLVPPFLLGSPALSLRNSGVAPTDTSRTRPWSPPAAVRTRQQAQHSVPASPQPRTSAVTGRGRQITLLGHAA